MAASDIISLPEAKDFLRISDTSSDAELGSFVTSASMAWAREVGPVAGSPTYDEWYDGGGPTIVLRHTPVQSVTSITEAFTDSIAYTLTSDPLDGTGTGGAYGYTFETNGLLVRRAVGTPVSFAGGVRNIHVVYVAGYATVPEDIKQAVKFVLRRMWESQRGGNRRSSDAPEPPDPSSWPVQAREIRNSYNLPGIA